MIIAIIGTGTLGPAIAQVFAQCEKTEKVYLCKGRETSESDGRDKIERAFEKLAAKGKLTQEEIGIWVKSWWAAKNMQKTRTS